MAGNHFLISPSLPGCLIGLTIDSKEMSLRCVALVLCSDQLRKALGLRKGEVPEYIYNMRVLGYPPGYKLAGSNWSGMSMYDEHQSSTGGLGS